MIGIKPPHPKKQRAEVKVQAHMCLVEEEMGVSIHMH